MTRRSLKEREIACPEHDRIWSSITVTDDFVGSRGARGQETGKHGALGDELRALAVEIRKVGR